MRMYVGEFAANSSLFDNDDIFESKNYLFWRLSIEAAHFDYCRNSLATLGPPLINIYTAGDNVVILL